MNAKNYFDKINAPDKKLYLLPSAGHMPMLDQPKLFFDSLVEINNRNKKDCHSYSNKHN